MMKIRTKAMGEVEIRDEQIVVVEDGPFGFEGLERYALVPHKEDSPFLWLQSLDDENLAFIVIDPRFFRPDYTPKLSPADLELLEFGEGDETLVLSIVVIPPDPKEMTANLQGPVVINARTRRGRQLISADPSHRARHRILDEMAESAG